jgi:hypothetical protein
MPWGDRIVPRRGRVQVKKVEDVEPEAEKGNPSTPEAPAERYRPPGWSRETIDRPSRRSTTGWGHK